MRKVLYASTLMATMLGGETRSWAYEQAKHMIKMETASEFMSRRSWLAAAGLAGAACWIADRLPLGQAAKLEEGVTFSFGTYGMKSLATEDAVRAIAEVGYDGVEIAVRPDWDAAPARMSVERRGAIRSLLRDEGLRLTALMEHLFPAEQSAEHQAGLDRLKQVAELGQAISPHEPPLIQTVLGNGKWDDVKQWYVERLADWADVAQQTETVIAVKPHRGGALSQPAEAAWLIQQLDDTPWIRMVYDYSHYAFRDLPVAQTVSTAAPYAVHVAIKDAVQADGGVKFLLPGESRSFDYAELFRLLYQAG